MSKQLYFIGYNGITETSLSEVLEPMPKEWHPLITKLIEKLFLAGWDGEISQIKEKFGELRFYIGRGNDEIFELIDDAEDFSSRRCDVCDKFATNYKIINDWFVNRCFEHKED